MAAKMFAGAPFGTQTARFDISAVHPQSKLPGTYTQTPYCKKSTDELTRRLGPGAYRIDVGGFNEVAVETRAQGPGWKRSYETMRLSKIPHLLYREQWEKKNELKRKLGPGTYNTEKADFICALDKKPSSSRGICATRSRRFRESYDNSIPGPGTYGKGGVPASLKEERERKSASTTGLLDAGSSTPRSLPIQGCELAPGRYEKLSFTDEILGKVVSNRGPYDLFTGERNKTNKTGHYATIPAGDLGPGEYNLQSFLHRWSDEHRRKHGQFGKVKQYPDVPTDRIYCCTLSQCPKNTEFPASNTYSPRSPASRGGRNLPPYLSSAERFDKRAEKFFTGNNNQVGAGRYNVDKWNHSQHRYGSSHVFTSSFPRFDTYERNYFLRERIRGKDLRAEDKVFLVQPPRGFAAGVAQ